MAINANLDSAKNVITPQKLADTEDPLFSAAFQSSAPPNLASTANSTFIYQRYKLLITKKYYFTSFIQRNKKG